MALGVRGINPLWVYVDLDGNLFDDTYYMWVLNNDIPYTPQYIYSDDDLNVPLQNPVQFLANGTLPIDIFFAPDIVYRLEFRQGNVNFPSQSDPLIYLVENYVPTGGTGGGDIITAAFPTDNQITNPQFSIINFFPGNTYSIGSPTTLDIDLAPGWFLHLEGFGNYTLNRVAYNYLTPTQTNAPYALNIVLSGTWTVSYIYQTFSQNGVAWSNFSSQNPVTVSSSVTARIDGASVMLTSQFVDSNGDILGVISYDNGGLVTTSFTEFQGNVTFGPSTNPDFPPAAYTQFQINIPNNSSIYLTSLQLVVGQEAVDYEYTQDTIERQIDNTFHYFYNSVAYQPKDSILTGWNFGQNPWQFTTTALTAVATNEYTADQTIVVQQNYVDTLTGSNVAVGQDTPANQQGFIVSAITANNQFALIQYIDTATMAPFWGNVLSALVQVNAAQPVSFKMKLIYNTVVPPAVSQMEPIMGWSLGQEPMFNMGNGWQVLSCTNDTQYNLAAGVSNMAFGGFQLPAATTGTMVLGVVLYTTSPIPISGTVTILSASLSQNDISVIATPLTFDDTLRRCQYYYEKSYNNFILPGTPTSGGFCVASVDTTIVTAPVLTNFFLHPYAFGFRYKTTKRVVPSVSLYSIAGMVGNVTGGGVTNGGTQLSFGNVSSGNWTVPFGIIGTEGIAYTPVAYGTIATGSVITTSVTYITQIYYHYTADATIGGPV